MTRTFVALAGFVSAVLCPAWVVLVLMAGISVRYRAFEMVLLGMCLDFIWQAPDLYLGIPIFTVIALAFLWIFEPVRDSLLLD